MGQAWAYVVSHGNELELITSSFDTKLAPGNLRNAKMIAKFVCANISHLKVISTLGQFKMV